MATNSGTLVNNVESPYSDPKVCYSVPYTASRTNASTKSISITLTFKAWLKTSGSWLGTGKILVAYARISGGAWKSVTIKGKNESWRGTATHSASPITLTGSSTASKVTIECYVVRADGDGNAGKLGTKSNPKKYTATFPAYSAPTPTPEPQPEPTINYGLYYKASGTWKKATAYVKPSGTWEKTTPHIKISGTWKKGVI